MTEHQHPRRTAGQPIEPPTVLLPQDTAPTEAGVTASIDIAAAPEEVFAYLVTVKGMLAWMGQHAVLDPTPGGEFSVDIDGVPVRGRYLVVDPPHQVVVSWGHVGSTDLPAGKSQVSFTLAPHEDGTRVVVNHTGLPTHYLGGHQRGWDHFLARLRLAGTGQDPGPDPWFPGEQER